MGHFILAMLLPLLFQTSTPNPAAPSQPAPAVASQAGEQGSPGVAQGSSTPSSQPAAPRPRSQDEIDEFVEQKIREALSGLPSDGDPQMSPEAEKAIETAVEKFLADPEMKSRIAETTHQALSLAEQGIRLGLISTILFFVTLALVVWLLYRRSQSRMQARMEFHQQVLSKFTSGQEFAEFLNSKGSQQLFEGISGGQVNLRERLLKHVRLGAIFAVLGLGLLALAIVTTDDGYGFLAVLSLGLGIGFLISARVSYRLSEKMGLLRENGSGDGNATGTQP